MNVRKFLGQKRNKYDFCCWLKIQKYVFSRISLGNNKNMFFVVFWDCHTLELVVVMGVPAGNGIVELCYKKTEILSIYLFLRELEVLQISMFRFCMILCLAEKCTT